MTYSSVIPERGNKPTIASGLLAIPEDSGTSLPLVSYQHGTVYGKQEVPSFPQQSPETQLMIAQFAGPIQQHGAWFYRNLFWEAGVVGQVLYLEAEAAGFRSTGIGCYFDDPVHDVLGLSGNQFQSLYHFTVGVPVEDGRLQSLPPYAHLDDGSKST